MNAACNAVVDAIDVGTSNASGLLRIGTAGMMVIRAEFVLSGVAFQSAINGTAIANPIFDDFSANASGMAAEFQVLNRNRAVVFSGNVMAGGGDLNLESLSIIAGRMVEVTSFSLTATTTA
jgi:hypothetical protein